jgi:hypothetical protein
LHGLARSLIDTNLEKRIQEDARNRVNREENRQKQIQTVLKVIDAKKRDYVPVCMMQPSNTCWVLMYLMTKKRGSSNRRTKHLSDMRRNCKNFFASTESVYHKEFE